MNWIDWLVIVVFCLSIMAIGLSLAKRAGKSMTSFFLAGRKMPWWLASCSMMATNFGSDTPLHQAGNARMGGITNSWFYIRGVFMELSIAFFYARLWRRANILTDVEFYELRHGSKSARALRIAIASYNSLFYAPFKIGLFTLAMAQISKVVLDLPETINLAGTTLDTGVILSIGLVLFALVYSATSGLWGVILTDFIELFIALFGTYVLYVLTIKAVGGPNAMITKLQAMTAEGTLSIDLTAMVPAQWWKSLGFLLLFSPLFWFADGELAPIQRLMACRSEKDAMLSQLVKTSANLAIRSWPWIICGLASVILIPKIADVNLVYPTLIKQLMPHGLIGLMMASFIAAFLSSTESYMNLGSAYFMNDLYRRFIASHKNEHHYVSASRFVTIAIALLGILVAVFSNNIFTLFTLLIKVTAGVHIVRALRWFWWRINGPAEVTALASAAVISFALSFWQIFFESGRIALATPAQLIINKFALTENVFSQNILHFAIEYSIITILVTVSWITVMFLTKPDSQESLKKFYRRIRPGGPGWKPIAKLCPDVQITDSLKADFAAWIVGCIFVYSFVFGFGTALFARWKLSIIMAVICIAAGFFLWHKVLIRYNRMAEFDSKLNSESVADNSAT